MVHSTMLLLVLKVMQVMVEAGDCSEFHPAACPLSEDNILGYNNSVQSITDCQERCGEVSACNFFTHYDSTCYHLSSCDSLEICQDCISGPPSPPFTSCPWPPSPTTDLPPTTTTTAGDMCGEILTDSVCYIDDTNIITTQHDMTVGECQDECQATGDCTWFVWYTHQTYLTFCWLLTHCQAVEPCTGCVCGPGTGPDVDNCIDTNTTTNTQPTPTTTTTTTTTTTCEVFSEAACDIDESNTLGVKHHLTVGECQDTCTASSLCHYFTWYPSLAMQGTCWLLDHCSRQEPCPYCVSGPGGGDLDVDDCVSTAPTTVTTVSTTTSGQSSTTTTMQDGCDMFSSATCDIDEDNNLEVVHDVTVTMCQNICHDNSACNYFTWSNVYGMLGACWLLDHCNNTEPCSSCISGPAEGVDAGHLLAP